MVWQDFMFACAVYELTPEFEANIRQEFIENVKRLRHHASLGAGGAATTKWNSSYSNVTPG